MKKMNKTNRQNTRNNAEVSRATMRRTIVALDTVATRLREENARLIEENARLKAELYIAQDKARTFNGMLTRAVNALVARPNA